MCVLCVMCAWGGGGEGGNGWEVLCTLPTWNCTPSTVFSDVEYEAIEWFINQTTMKNLIEVKKKLPPLLLKKPKWSVYIENKTECLPLFVFAWRDCCCYCCCCCYCYCYCYCYCMQWMTFIWNSNFQKVYQHYDCPFRNERRAFGHLWKYGKRINVFILVGHSFDFWLVHWCNMAVFWFEMKTATGILFQDLEFFSGWCQYYFACSMQKTLFFSVLKFIGLSRVVKKIC